MLGSHAHWTWAPDLISRLTPPDAHQQRIDLFIVNRQGEITFPESASGCTSADQHQDLKKAINPEVFLDSTVT